MRDPLIYPALPGEPVPAEQLWPFIPLADEVHWAREHTRSPKRQLELLVMLKTFRFLGYFPAPSEIPPSIVAASARRLDVPAPGSSFVMAPASLYRGRATVRRKLGVERWTPVTRRLLVNRLVMLNQGRAGPNDLLNAAVEYLRQDRIELPALRTLRRLVGSIRARFDKAFCAAIVAPLKGKDRRTLEGLMVVPPEAAVSGFERIKQRPARATLKHLTAHLNQLRWLQELPATQPLIAGLGFGKITDLAEQARALNVSELREHGAMRRLALLICLLHVARAECLDQLATLYLRRVHWMWGRAREDLEEWRRNRGGLSQSLVRLLRRMVVEFDQSSPESSLDDRLGAIAGEHGGAEVILRDCDIALEHRVNDPRSFLIRHYRRSRAVLMTLLAALPLDAEAAESWPVELADRLGFMDEDRDSVFSLLDVDPSRISAPWKPLVQRPGPGLTVDRRQFEVYAFCEVADALKAGEVFIPGSLAFADYRETLVARDLAAEPCQAFLRDRGLPTRADQFVDQLRNALRNAAWQLDELFKIGCPPCRIDRDGTLHLPRVRAAPASQSAQQLADTIESRLPERHLLDVLANVDRWTQWTRHFGPLSGESPQIKDPRRRYVETAFTYGCNLRPTQASRHLAGQVTPHMLSFVNRRHVDPGKLRAASTDIINAYAAFDLQRIWGAGVRAAADGTHIPIYDDNPFAAYHWRFRGMAGVAYRHVADSYIAIFSRFIPCGVAEAAYILDGLLNNKSNVRPHILHSDTRGQTAAAFAVAFLEGIELRPRIKNWRDLVFYKPSRDSNYRHINSLFKGTVNWKLIADHFLDYVQIGASVQTGTLPCSWLLTRLNSTSRRNAVFRAFHELGRVVRTIHMLEVLAEPDLLRPGGSPQNKVEAFHRFSKWLLFGGQGVLRSNDPAEYEKAVHYNELVANAVMLQTVADQTQVIRQLVEEGYPVRAEDLERLRPYATQHLKRFGRYPDDFGPYEPRPPTSLPL